MVNKEKAIKIELTRLRKTQNPEQIDFRRMRKLRAARTSLMKVKRKGTVAPVKVVLAEKKKAKPTKKPKKKDEELEVIEDKPELEVFGEEPEVEEKKPELEVVDEEPELEAVEDEPELEVVEEKPKSKKKPKKKKEKEPELEVVEDEADSEEISKDLEDLYSYDEDIDEKDVE